MIVTIIPFLNLWAEYTYQAALDVLVQSQRSDLLLIDNGSKSHEKRFASEWIESRPHVRLWSHNPPLPSLSATWNCALDYAWTAGADAAWIINNDVRLHPHTLEFLWAAMQASKAFFVSCVGVTEEQFDPELDLAKALHGTGKGGPDFSCFLVSRACHQKYRFDEAFTPAFCEDLDYHRRMMLGGDGERIFSINLPYLHYASQTLKSMQPEEREAHEKRIAEGSRAHYERVWGGPVNNEKWLVPYNLYSKIVDENPPRGCERGCITTPQLQAHGCRGRTSSA